MLGVQMKEKGIEIFGNHSSSLNNLGYACGWRPFTELVWVILCQAGCSHRGKVFWWHQAVINPEPSVLGRDKALC